MARDFLGEFGPDKKVGGGGEACGGITEAKPLSYKPPVGPTSQSQQGPGLHGETHKSGSQGSH